MRQIDLINKNEWYEVGTGGFIGQFQPIAQQYELCDEQTKPTDDVSISITLNGNVDLPSADNTYFVRCLTANNTALVVMDK